MQKTSGVISYKEFLSLHEKANESKYKAVAETVDGIRFPSGKQAKRYQELKLLLRAKVISDLKIEVPFELVVNGQLVCKYVADAVYRDKTGSLVVEDTKGVRTDVYKLKKKLMKAVHGIEILET